MKDAGVQSQVSRKFKLSVGLVGFLVFSRFASFIIGSKPLLVRFPLMLLVELCWLNLDHLEQGMIYDFHSNDQDKARISTPLLQR